MATGELTSPEISAPATAAITLVMMSFVHLLASNSLLMHPVLLCSVSEHKCVFVAIRKLM